MWGAAMTRKTLLLAFVFTICFGGQSRCGYHAPPEYRRVFDLPRDQQKDEFKKLTLDKQIEMYRYAMFQEPPDLAYSDFLASNGKEAIQHLLRHLQEEESDYFRARLIRVFRDMHKEYYNLSNEREVKIQLQNQSAKITDALWRKESERYIQIILNEPGLGDK